MEKLNKKKSGSRSRGFCMCFDPDFEDNGLAVEETERFERVEPVVSMAVNDEHDKDVVASFRRKTKLTRWFRVIFFETSLMKKIRSQKSGQRLNRTEKSKPKTKVLNSKSMDNTTPINEDYDSTSFTLSSSFTSGATTNSSSSSSTTTTTTAATSRCSSLSESVENRMQIKVGNYDNGKGCNGFNVGICSFIISLLVVVFWGKVCAIFCTSTWLFFSYQWSSIKPVASEKIAVVNPFAEIGTELYKKKVIMEGLLERNHRQNRSLALLKQF